MRDDKVIVPPYSYQMLCHPVAQQELDGDALHRKVRGIADVQRLALQESSIIAVARVHLQQLLAFLRVCRSCNARPLQISQDSAEANTLSSLASHWLCSGKHNANQNLTAS